jgi:preprotein translocase subunit SecF
VFIAAPMLGYLGIKRDTVGAAPKPKEQAPVIAPASAAGADRASAAARSAPKKAAR